LLCFGLLSKHLLRSNKKFFLLQILHQFCLLLLLSKLHALSGSFPGLCNGLFLPRGGSGSLSATLVLRGALRSNLGGPQS
jgi:hypothetical protein